MIDKVMIEKLRSLPIEQVADALGMGLRWHNAICPSITILIRAFISQPPTIRIIATYVASMGAPSTS